MTMHQPDSISTTPDSSTEGRHVLARVDNGSASVSTDSLTAKRLPLVDSFGRVHKSLRISVTDRCNIRCQYCMPESPEFLDSARLLSFDAIAQFTQVAATLGIRKVRITGGEPLMRPRLFELIARLRAIQGIDELALTTNGMLLADQVEELASAGLERINISLDTLREQVFQRLARRSGLDRVMAGIDAALQIPSLRVRLNALVMRDVNLTEVCDLVEFALERNLAMRFIEFMPLDAERNWNRSQMVSGDELRKLLAERFGPLVPVDSNDPSQPSTDYTFAGRPGIVGFIDSVSQPFCGACDRLRLTADGKIRNCLFSQQEWDVRQMLEPASNGSVAVDHVAELERQLRECLWAKRAAHGIDSDEFRPPERAMFQIGG